MNQVEQSILNMSEKLRIAILSFVMSCSLSAGAWAQLRQPFIIPAAPKDTSMFWIFKDVTAGPYFTAGISRQNENLPEPFPGAASGVQIPWHSEQRFAYVLGGTIDFFYSQWLGLDLSMLYDARDLYLGDAADCDNIDLSLGYLSIQPSIRIFWLLLGFSFDIPMSGSAVENLAIYSRTDHPVSNYSANVNMQTSDLLPLTELRATLSIPILETDNAYLHLIVSGSYPLSKTIAGTTSFDTTGYTPTSGITSQYGRFSGPAQAGKGPLPTIQAGISYQFDLIH